MEDFFRFFTERQKEVYKLREQKMTFVQIGNTLGISQNAARQHYQNALRRIREYEAYNRMVEHNNQPVDFPITRGELKLIYMGLNELTKVKPYKVTQSDSCEYPCSIRNRLRFIPILRSRRSFCSIFVPVKKLCF